ncbi:nitroreductase family protein [Acidimicrobiales bacterium]|jgi:nitroreductase|nr:nitroreductase family protein [Acidimicrobiales bacterium]
MAAPTPEFEPGTEQYHSLVDHALMTTRGVRRRLDFERDVDDQTILDCIDVAEQAPTGGNNGSRRWIVIRDQDTKDRMAELYLSAGVDWVIQAADRLKGTGHQNEALMQGAKHLGENISRAPALVIPTVIGRHDGSGRPGLFDSVIQSAWSFMVALRARGLGTVWTTMYLNEADAVAELLDLPDEVTQICLFPVAYTVGTDFKATSRRYPARDITYFDRYGRTLAEGRSEPRSIVDGPGQLVEIDIKARPEIVWEFVSDVNLSAEFSEEFQGGEWDDPDGDSGVGSTFTGHNKHPQVGEWSTTSHVTVWDPPREFAWSVADLEAPAAQWRFTVEKVPGGSRLRYHVRLGPGRSGLTPAIEAMPDKEARIVAGRQREHQQNMQRVIKGIKEKAETQAAVERSDPSGFPR